MIDTPAPARSIGLLLADRRIAGATKPISDPRGSDRRRPSEDGFVLLETLVSISLIMVVMAAFTTFFVNSVAFTSQQRATQVAIQIANSTIQGIRALPASDLSPSADGVAAPVSTTASTQTVNNVVYSIDEYIETPKAGAVGVLRAVVAVTWAGGRLPDLDVGQHRRRSDVHREPPPFDCDGVCGSTQRTAGRRWRLEPPWVRQKDVHQPTVKNPVPPFRVAITDGTLPPVSPWIRDRSDLRHPEDGGGRYGRSAHAAAH